MKPVQTCKNCERFEASPVASLLALVGRAIDDGALDDAAYAARTLEHYGVEVTIVPARIRGDQKPATRSWGTADAP